MAFEVAYLAFITESPKGEKAKSSSFRDKRNKFDDGLLEEGVDLKRSLKAECLGICSSKNNTRVGSEIWYCFAVILSEISFQF